jgi:nucleoside phosphorylase
VSTSLPVDVGIVIALKEEFTELHNQIKDSCKAVRDQTTGGYYYLFEHQCVNQETCYRCVATFAGNMGPTKAGLVTQRLVTEFKPSTIVMLGIAAGITDDVKLGDVIVATQVDAYMENSKAEGEDEFTLALGGEIYRPSADVVNFSQNFQFVYSNEFQQWQDSCARELTRLFPDKERLDALIKQGLLREQAHLIAGHIASGPTVGAAQGFIQWLKRRNRKYLGLEMEAAGLMAAVYEEAIPRRTLVLRAVSDCGDQRKGNLDKINSGAFRLYAIRNAIALLWSFLNTNALPLSVPNSLAYADNENKLGHAADVTSPQVELSADYQRAVTSVPLEQIDALSRVIETEIVPLDDTSSSKTGGNDVNPARELSVRFLTLPLYKRIRLAQKLGLLTEEEKSLEADELSKRIFNRAKEEKKLDQLWDEVEEAYDRRGNFNPIQNPFLVK